jgi:hypothetical protein
VIPELPQHFLPDERPVMAADIGVRWDARQGDHHGFVDQLAAAALGRETPDEAVRVDPVGATGRR